MRTSAPIVTSALPVCIPEMRDWLEKIAPAAYHTARIIARATSAVRLLIIILILFLIRPDGARDQN